MFSESYLHLNRCNTLIINTHKFLHRKVKLHLLKRL